MKLPDATRSFLGWRELLALRRDFLGTVGRFRARHGPCVGFRIGPVYNAMFCEPEAVGQVLKSRAASFLRHPQTMRVFRQWNGNSVLVSEGQAWLRNRRLLAPAFVPQHIDRYAACMVERVERSFPGPVENLAVVQAMVPLTLGIFCAAMFDLHDDLPDLQADLQSLAEIAMLELFLPWPLPLWLPIPLARRKKRVIARLRGLVEELIARKSANRVEGAASRGEDLLSFLLATSEEGERLSPTQLRDEMVTLLLAGHDTTAAGLCWMLDNLARHPEVAERVAEEGRQLSEQGISALRYTEQVAKETLRLAPPAPGMFLRQSKEPVTILDYPLPVGTLVHLPCSLVHRDERWFPDPERFDPDRFGPDQRRPDFSYFPFGGGPRICLGQSFALLEMAVVAAVLLRRYRLEPGPRPASAPATLRISLWPAWPLRVSLRPR